MCSAGPGRAEFSKHHSPSLCLQMQGVDFARDVVVLAENVEWPAWSLVEATSAFTGPLPTASTAIASFNVSGAGVTQNNHTIVLGELRFPGALTVDSRLAVRALTSVTYSRSGDDLATPDSSTFSLFAYDLTLACSRPRSSAPPAAPACFLPLLGRGLIFPKLEASPSAESDPTCAIRPAPMPESLALPANGYCLCAPLTEGAFASFNV